MGDLSSRARRGTLPSRSTRGSYGVLREAQRGAHPLDLTSSSQLKPTMQIRRFGFSFQRALLPAAGVHVESNLPRQYILHVETQHAASLQPPTMCSPIKNLPQAWNLREVMRVGCWRAAGGHAGRSFRSSKCQYPGICFARRQELLIE